MGKPGHLLEYTAEVCQQTCLSIPLGEYTNGRVGGGDPGVGEPDHLLEYTAEVYQLICSSIPLGEYTNGLVGGGGTLVWGNPVICSSIPQKYTS